MGLEEFTRIQCPACSAPYRVQPETLGRQVKCTKCRKPFVAAATLDLPADDGTYSFGDEEPPEPPRRGDATSTGPRRESEGPEEKLATGKDLLAEGDHEAALDKFSEVLDDVPDWESAQVGAHEALKLRFAVNRFFRKFGLNIPFIVATHRSRQKYWLWGMLAGVPAVAVKMMRENSQLERYLWPVVAMIALVVVLARAFDAIATIRLWFSEYRGWVLVRGDVVGAWIELALMVLAAGCAISMGVTQQYGFPLAGILMFFWARPIVLACTTRALSARAVVIVYVVAIGIIGFASVWPVLLSSDPAEWKVRFPPSAVKYFVVFIMGALMTRPLRAIVAEFLGSGRPLYDARSYATLPGAVSLSHARLRRLHPELYGIRSLFHRLTHFERGVSAKDARDLVKTHLQMGAANPAVVLSTSPLVIAAYSEDLDCIVPLQFDERLVSEFDLRRGQRMLSVNCYQTMNQREIGNDLVWGENHTGTWGNVSPAIAEFLSDDREAIEERKSRITDEAWSRLMALAGAWRGGTQNPPRDGRPLMSHVSGKLLKGVS